MAGRAAFLVAFFVVVAASTAHAAPWEPKGKPARALLDEGRGAFKAGDYARAADLFFRSSEAEANLNAQWNAAQALAAAGEWKRAADLLDQLVKDRTLPRKRRAEIEKRHRVAVVFVAADFAAAAQRWDDASDVLRKLLADPAIGDRDRASASAAIEAVAQARAQAEAAAAEAERAREAEAERARREAEAEREPAAVMRQPDPVASPAPPTERPSRVGDIVAWSLLGVGTVGAGIGAGLLWNAGELEDDANNETNQQRVIELRDRADSRRTAGLVALGVGGAVLIAGAIKLAIPPDAPQPAVQRTAGGAVVLVGGVF